MPCTCCRSAAALLLLRCWPPVYLQAGASFRDALLRMRADEASIRAINMQLMRLRPGTRWACGRLRLRVGGRTCLLEQDACWPLLQRRGCCCEGCCEGSLLHPCALSTACPFQLCRTAALPPWDEGSRHEE